MPLPIAALTLMERAKPILESPWTYVSLGGMFLGILSFAIWHLIKQRPSCPGAPANNAAGLSRPQNAADIILSLNGKGRCVLWAGSGIDALPITIPVNVAVELAKKNKKCLLIDLDTRRNAAAQVFEMDSDAIEKAARPAALPTAVDNLYLWPARYFVRFNQCNIKTIVQKAATQYDIVLINAPFLDTHPDRKQIASVAGCGFIHCHTPAQHKRLSHLLDTGGCPIHTAVNLPAAARLLACP